MSIGSRRAVVNGRMGHALGMTPIDLAEELMVDPRAIRAWLRRNHPRSEAEKHQRWHLDARLAGLVRAQFS